MADEETPEIISREPPLAERLGLGRRRRQTNAMEPASAAPDQAEPEPDPPADDEDLAELARMEKEERRASRRADRANRQARWGVNPADSPFADETPDGPEYERYPETRTAASTGARGPLMLAVIVAGAIHALPPLSTVLERSGSAGMIAALTDTLSPGLWERLAPLRHPDGFEPAAIGALSAGLCVVALVQAGSRLRQAVQMFGAAAIINAADWFLFTEIQKAGVLTPAEVRAALAFAAIEGLVALGLWLRVAPPLGWFSKITGRRT